MRFLALLALLVVAAGCGIIESITFNNFGDVRSFKHDPDFGKPNTSDAHSRTPIPGEEIVKMINVVHIEVVGKDLVGLYWSGEHATSTLSGVIVLHGGTPYVLTAGHAIPQEFSVMGCFAYFQGRNKPPEKLELALRDTSAHMDFALFSFGNPDFVYEGPVPILGSSRTLKNGEKVYALGSPLSVPFAISEGVVMNNGFNAIILHSALSNPGNSGGPLVNQYGEVVGITIAGMRMGASHNPFVSTMPAALPIDDIITVVRRRKEGGEAVHPALQFGVNDSSELNDIDFAKNGVKRPKREGVIVTRPGSDLERGDIILSCDGVAITDEWQLVKLLQLEHGSGDTVVLRIDRYGEEKEIRVTLE